MRIEEMGASADPRICEENASGAETAIIDFRSQLLQYTSLPELGQEMNFCGLGNPKESFETMFVKDLTRLKITSKVKQILKHGHFTLF